MPIHMDPYTLPLDRVDLSDVALFAGGPPHALFARMRELAPVHWSPTADGGFWSLTRAEDIARVSRDTATFSSEQGGVWLNRNTPPRWSCCRI